MIYVTSPFYQDSYHDSSYSSSSTAYDSYGGGSDTHRSPHLHASSSITSPSQPITLQQSPSITQPYHPNISAAFSTPPVDTLPSNTLPDTSNSLRPYAYSSHQQPSQYRSGSGSNPTTPSRHQSPQMYAYSPRVADDGASNVRPMSIDGRPSLQPQPLPALPKAGFRRVRGPADLRPRVNAQPSHRRADPSGNGMFLSVSLEGAPALCLLQGAWNITNSLYNCFASCRQT